MAKSKAWILTAPGRHVFAVGEAVMVELDISAKVYPVPATPSYCSHVVYWRRRFIPLFNIGKWFDAETPDTVQKVGILAYQTEPMAALQHVGVMLLDYPERIVVDDEQVCEAPEAYAKRFPHLVQAAFTHHGREIPVLNINYLCSAQLLSLFHAPLGNLRLTGHSG